MSTFRNKIFLFFSLSLFCSCFEAVEEITFITDKKGSYSITLNCSQSRDRLKTLFKLDTFMGIKVPGTSEISTELYAAANALRSTPGVHNVISNSDFEDCIFSISFGFDSTAALNQGIKNAIQSASKNNPFKYSDMFSGTEKSFGRDGVFADSLMLEASKKQEHLKLIDGSTLTSIYRFNRQVSSVTHNKAKISKNQKAVMLKQSIISIINNPSLIKNQITLK